MKSLAHTRRGFPQIDFHFQSDCRSAGGLPPAIRDGRRAFRVLRHEVFRGANRRGDLREALLFGALVGLSAWPIATMIGAILKLVR